MNAGKQNPNTGGKGSSAISQIVPTKVSVTSPDNSPVQKPNSGSSFIDGSPAGSEAQPHGENHGWDDVRIGS
jgi:hypothetical protein